MELHPVLFWLSSHPTEIKVLRTSAGKTASGVALRPGHMLTQPLLRETATDISDK